MEKQGNMTQSKEQNKYPDTDAEKHDLCMNCLIKNSK